MIYLGKAMYYQAPKYIYMSKVLLVNSSLFVCLHTSLDFLFDELCVFDFGAVQSRVCRGGGGIRTWTPSRVYFPSPQLLVWVLWSAALWFYSHYPIQIKPVDITIKIRNPMKIAMKLEYYGIMNGLLRADTGPHSALHCLIGHYINSLQTEH